jgi:hypothetical protein
MNCHAESQSGLFLILFSMLFVVSLSEAQMRIGFVDPALPKETPRRNAAAMRR